MRPWWIDLFEDQLRRSGFADIAGADASVRAPVSDRLLSRVLQEQLRGRLPVRDLELLAFEGNQLAIRVRVAKPAFLPLMTFRFHIERQPSLPESAVLVLRLASQGLGALVGPLLRLFDVLPPGVARDGSRFLIDLREVASRQGVAEYFAFLTSLEITTGEGRVIVAATAAVPDQPRK